MASATCSLGARRISRVAEAAGAAYSARAGSLCSPVSSAMPSQAVAAGRRLGPLQQRRATPRRRKAGATASASTYRVRGRRVGETIPAARRWRSSAGQRHGGTRGAVSDTKRRARCIALADREPGDHAGQLAVDLGDLADLEARRVPAPLIHGRQQRARAGLRAGVGVVVRLRRQVEQLVGRIGGRGGPDREGHVSHDARSDVALLAPAGPGVPAAQRLDRLRLAARPVRPRAVARAREDARRGADRLGRRTATRCSTGSSGSRRSSRPARSSSGRTTRTSTWRSSGG